MKRSTKQLLSLLLAIVMVCGLMAPAMAARPMMGGDVAETPVGETAAAKPATSPLKAYVEQAKAELLTAGEKSSVNFADVTAFAAGSAPAGGTSSVDGKIKVIYGTKGFVDTNNKTFDDGTSGTQRYRSAASTFTATPTDVIELKPTAKSVLKIWWVYDKADRLMNVYKAGNDGAPDTTTPVWESGTGADNKIMFSRINLPEAGTYYIGFPTNDAGKSGAYVFKVEMTEVDTEPTVTETTWDDVGTLTISAAKALDAESNPIDNKVDVTVSGVDIGDAEDASLNVTKGAEKVTVELLKDGASTTPATTKTITKWTTKDGSNKVTFDLPGTGSYTFKATATRGAETPKEATTTDAITYNPELAKPVVTAKVDDGKVKLSWNAVAEATGYEVYQDGVKVDATVAEEAGSCSVEITGLTNGTEYSFTVKALRNTESAESDPVKATPAVQVTGAPKTYVFDAGEETGYAKATVTADRNWKAGTDDHFTVYDLATKSEVVAANIADQDGAPFDDNYEPQQRFSTGGKFSKLDAGTISFDTAMAATIKVWWGNNGAGRSVALYKGTSTTPVKTDGTSVATKDNALISTFKVDEAGTYTVGGVSTNGGGIYIYKIEVKETKPAVTMKFDAGEETGYAKATVTADRNWKAGTDDFFTVYDLATKSEVVAANIADQDGAPFDDNYEPQQRFSTGGKFSKLDAGTIAFTTTEAAKIKVWWGNNGAGRSVGLYKGTSTTPVKSDGASVAVKDNALISTFKVDEADTYTIGGLATNGGGIYIYRIDVIYGDSVEEVTAKWDADSVGKPTIGTVTVDANTITVAVSGAGIGTVEGDDAITTYADKVVVGMYDSEGELVATQEITAISDKAKTNTVDFEPAVSGNYTFKAAAVRAGETDIEGEMSTATAFILPLAVPSINSVASNGKESGKDTASVTVAWSSVVEASSYNLYVRAKGATEWDPAIEVPATTAANVNAVVTDLTVDAEYEFAVEAVRAATTIGGVSIPASTTAKSDVAEVTVAATKQIPWTTKVFGTSATASVSKIDKETPEISVVGLDGNPVTEAPSNGILSGTVTYDFSKSNKDGDISTSTHKETIENLTGDLNTDPEQRILLSSRDGAGKITEPNGSDGMLFHYTTVPAGYNFKLKAKVHVARWFTRDTQNGLGLAVVDRVPAESQTGSGSSNSGDYWNNGYMAGAARIGFTYDSTNGKYYGTGSAMSATTSGDMSYSYYMGLVSILKHGNDKDHPSGAGNAPTSMYDRLPLDTRLPRNGISVRYNNNNNRFNTIGNYTKLPAGYSVQAEKTEGASNKFMENYELTDFILQLEKTPTGYVSTAWTADGNTELGTVTQYFSKGAPELSACEGNDAANPYIHYAGAVNAENAVDLSGNVDKGIEIMDPSAEYVGFFTSRDTDAMFTLLDFDMWPQAEDDTPAETPPVTIITPSVKFTSGTSANTEDFVLSFTSNVKGTITITKGGATVGTVEMTTAGTDGVIRGELPVKLSVGTNTYNAKLTVAPDEEQGLPPYTEINPNPKPSDLEATTAISYRTYYQSRENLYVAPNGSTSARGSRVSPLDIHTAVSVVAPGQNIVMMAGEYKLSKTIDITPAMDGTKDAKIYMVPDVDENGEPVKVILNGQGKAGTVIKTGADWWVFDNFEVVNSSSGSKGFLVGGSHNVVQNVSVHDNGSSGLSVTRYNGNVKVPVRDSVNVPADQVTDWGEWPCDNLILNCTSYRNYDQGYNGADGFEAKEAVGSGNVFDGCIAFWNADDGWDLYAKADADKGCLGVVTIRNSITFQNGYEVRKIIDSQTQTPALVEGSTYLPVMNTDADGNLVLAPAGNGNGFKMGGSHMPGAHVISNSYAFYNKAKGFDSNNGPDISVIDCTSYNNGDENVGLSSNATLAFVVTNVVSFKDGNCPIGNEEKEMMADGIKEGAGNKITNHYKWDGTKVTINGVDYTKDDGDKLFESLDFDATVWWDGALRDADGSLALPEGFLQLKAGVADGAGAGDLINGTEQEPVTPEKTPDAVTDPAEEPASGGNGGGGGGGNGGTVGADKNEPKPDETTPVYVANKTTNAAGDTTIVVKDDKTGETVAEVTIPATIPTPETKFVDVPDDHWAAEAINNMAGMDIVNGIGNDAFGTDQELTRAQLATMLYRFANGKAGIDNTFADVADGQWYTDAIGWAVKVGVVTGYSADAFGPNDVITREQLAVMLARFAKLVGLDTEATSALADFADRNAVSNWATDGMNWCVSSGIINGVSEGTLSPKTSATRAQTALMLDRFIGLMK